ncbi:MAG: radical SAM protein [Chloroflexi bacterium]|nr:radical SAM protein [Chloroflexota bacterium]
MSRSALPVLLVNSNRMQPPVAPIALDYLDSALSRLVGVPRRVLDLCFTADPEAEIAHALSGQEVGLVAVTFRNTDDCYYAGQDFFVPGLKEVVDALRRHTGAPVVLGGAGFSVMPEAIMEYCGVDLGVWGEGEVALPRLALQLAGGGDPSAVPGLVHRRGDSLTRNRAEYMALGQLDASAREAADNVRYFREGAMVGVESKRGCPMRCIYCADPVGKGRRRRLRSPHSVAQEVASLVERGVDHIHFCDSEFNLPEAHSRAVAAALIERGLGGRVRWYAYASPAPFSDELARLWLESGCAGIDFGVDSGSDAMLQALGRHFSVAQVVETAHICQRQGLTFMYDLLLGGPGETPDSLRETIELMVRLGPDRVGASLGVRIFPGTRLAQIVLDQGPLEANPNLRGTLSPNLVAPVFYVSSALGDNPLDCLSGLIGGDQRFFTPSTRDTQDYNYNRNQVLVDAIREGYRGAFWDILRRKPQSTDH